MKHPVDAVFGYVHGYGWAEVSAFVGSLRRAGFAGEIRFFCSRVPPAELARMRAEGVRAEVAPYRPTRIKNRLDKLWWLCRRLPPALRRSALARVANLTIFRHLLYETTLRQEAASYRRVLLADVRDIWFQADPFRAGCPPGVEVFAEARGRTIASEPYNRRWVEEAFLGETRRRLLQQPILCAGTILGSTACLARFLGHFRECFYQARSLHSPGIDQGVFNHAVRTYPGDDLTIHPNGDAAVLTMGLMAEEEFRRDAAGRIVRPDGSVIPILHQYDRHPRIAREILGPLAPAAVPAAGSEGEAVSA